MRKQVLHPHTATINCQQKNSSKKAREAALQWLTETFPEAFNITRYIRPLKQGIMRDILAYAEQAAVAGISKSKLREAVVMFTRRLDYLACLKAKEMRIDLAGNAVSAVTEEEANNAALKIKKRIEKSAINSKKNSVDKIKTISSTDQAISTENMTIENKPAVTIRRKVTRPYDPDMVQRLKDKLGLVRRNDEKN